MFQFYNRQKSLSRVGLGKGEKETKGRIRKTLKFIWNEFVYGGHLQCLGIVGIVYITGFLLNIKIGWEILLLSYLIFYPIYVNDRLSAIKIDGLTNPERTKHFKIYLRMMPKILIFSILLLVILLFYFRNLKLSIFALTLLFLGLLYPLYFKNVSKKIIAFKDFYTAGFFSVIVFLPIIYYSLNFLLTISLIILVLFIFLKAVLMQILFDIKDIEGDKLLGLKTIPILIGKEKTLTLLRISSLVITILIIPFAVFFLHSFSYRMLILLFTIPFNFYSYNLVQKQSYYGYIIGSGEFLFWLILILIAKVII